MLKLLLSTLLIVASFLSGSTRALAMTATHAAETQNAGDPDDQPGCTCD